MLTKWPWTMVLLALTTVGFAQELEQKIALDPNQILDSVDGISRNQSKKNCPENQADEEVTSKEIEKEQEEASIFFNVEYAYNDQQGRQQVQGTSMRHLNLGNFLDYYKRRSRQDESTFLNLPRQEQESYLGSFIDNRLDIVSPQREDVIASTLTYLEMSKMANDGVSSDEIYRHVGAKMKDASFSQKLNLLGLMLGEFNRVYDMDRTDQTKENSKGSVYLDEMLNATYLKNMGEEYIDRGVCRDMHQAAVKMAHAMGMEHTYGVSYATREVRHLNLVTSDPNDRTKTYILNYGSLYVNDGVVQSPALNQHGIDDTGLGFQIWDKDNRPVYYLPSEKGAVLNLVTGGKDKDFDQLYTHQSVIQQGGIITPYATIRAFQSNSNDVRDETLVGVSFTKRIDYNDFFYGDYGLAVYHSTKNKDGITTMDENGVYASVTHGVRAELVNTPGLKVTADSALKLYGSTYKVTTPDDDPETEYKSNKDGNGFVNSKIVAQYQLMGIAMETEAGGALSLNGKDALDIAQGIAPYSNGYYIRQTASVDVNDDLNLTGVAGLHAKNFGGNAYNSYELEAKASYRPSSSLLSVRTSGPLSEGMPIWIPGAERQVNVSFNQKLADRLYLSANGKYSFDVPGAEQVTIGVRGNF